MRVCLESPALFLLSLYHTRARARSPPPHTHTLAGTNITPAHAHTRTHAHARARAHARSYLIHESLNRTSRWRPSLCSLPRHVPLPLFHSPARLAAAAAALPPEQRPVFEARLARARDAIEGRCGPRSAERQDPLPLPPHPTRPANSPPPTPLPSSRYLLSPHPSHSAHRPPFLACSLVPLLPRSLPRNFPPFLFPCSETEESERRGEGGAEER